MLIKAISEFNLAAARSTGGVTGSCCVQSNLDNKNYQLKPSILKNPSTIRRFKADHTDRENFGEFIASHIGHAIARDPHSVPEVSLVYDPTEKSISVASRYLTGDSVNTMDDFARERGIKVPNKKHVKCVPGTNANANHGEINLDSEEFNEIKPTLTDAIVLSAVLGDHDINPGNMLIVSKKRKAKVARIDFGHAFNDLLNTSEVLGGGLQDANHPILDFFNREKIAGLPLGAPSKLARDYPGLIPCQEMVDSMQVLSSRYQARLSEGTHDAKIQFKELLELLQDNGDIASIEHVKNSLCAIYNNITDTTLDPKKHSTQDILNTTFAAYENFVRKNCEDLTNVSHIMQLQLAIDDTIKNGTPLSSENLELIKQQDFPTRNGQIQWVKNHNGTAFSGSILNYVQHRTQELQKQAKTEKKPPINTAYCEHLTQQIQQASTQLNPKPSQISIKQRLEQIKHLTDKDEGLSITSQPNTPSDDSDNSNEGPS